ncbi:MAG: N-carbamoylsarcosine amidohydrolase [Dehalococcoidia bacterium]|nr:N-carbamoylsarcosine amidohydrolase [Dehalococcoidia bacterium]
MTDQQTADFYKSRGFSNLVGFGDSPALLIIDYTTGFTDPTCALGANFDAEVAATRQLLDVAREKQIPIIFTTVVYDENFREAGWFIKKAPALANLKEGSPWTAIDPRLTPQRGEHVVVKKYASAFFGTNVASLLTSSRCDTVIVTGVTTSGCVRASVVDSLQHGFRTIVVREAVGDRAPGPHEANLFDMHAKYADVVSLTETLEYLRALPARERERAAAR